MGKKRKYEVDIDAERTLHGSFVSAANAVSQMYMQAVQQQRKTSTAASRQTLERVICFLLREFNGAEHVSKTALLHFLQQEYEGLEGSENVPYHFPVHFIPAVHHGTSSATGDDGSIDAAGKTLRSSSVSAMAPSPARRAQSHSTGPTAMDAYSDRHGGSDAAAEGPTSGGLYTAQQQQAAAAAAHQRGFQFPPGSFGSGQS